MKFKYMIRGMGIGVVITAAVMGAYSRNAVADARVAVLREYGLGEDSRLADETENSSEGLLEEPSAPEQAIVRDDEKESEISSVLDAAKQSEQAGMAGQEVQPSAQPSKDSADPVESPDVNASEPSDANAVLPPDEGGASGDAVQIVIASGDDSGTVARKLYNAGLIGNADEYDSFLIQHGYDKRLTTGTKIISATDSWQEIADKITR